MFAVSQEIHPWDVPSFQSILHQRNNVYIPFSQRCPFIPPVCNCYIIVLKNQSTHSDVTCRQTVHEFNWWATPNVQSELGVSGVYCISYRDEWTVLHLENHCLAVYIEASRSSERAIYTHKLLNQNECLRLFMLTFCRCFSLFLIVKWGLSKKKVILLCLTRFCPRWDGYRASFWSAGRASAVVVLQLTLLTLLFQQFLWAIAVPIVTDWCSATAHSPSDNAADC